jgi:hypothetical protein
MVENYPFAGIDFLFLLWLYHFGTGSKSGSATVVFHVEHLPSHRILGLALALALFHVEQTFGTTSALT